MYCKYNFQLNVSGHAKIDYVVQILKHNCDLILENLPSSYTQGTYKIITSNSSRLQYNFCYTN